MYAVIAAIGIGIFAAVLTGGFFTKTPTANGNSIDMVKTTEERIGTGVLAAGTDNDNLFQLFVTGSATKKISPDKVSVILGVQTQEKTAQEAARKNADIMNAVINGLKDIGISTSQISTSYYNIYPVYEYRPVIDQRDIPPYPQNQVLIGYRVTNTISVTASADANVGNIIDTAINAGANEVQGVSYFVSEEVQKQMNSEMIGDAVLNAKMKAERALAPLNMKIVGVKSLNLNDVFYPVYRFDKFAVAEGAAPPTPILPSEQQVSASVSVTFIIG